MALIWIGAAADTKTATPALIDALKIDRHRHARELVILAMAITRDRRVVKPLVDLITSTADEENRVHAMNALAQLSGIAAPAVPALISLYNSLPEDKIYDDWGERTSVTLAAIGQSTIPAIDKNLRNLKLSDADDWGISECSAGWIRSWVSSRPCRS